GLCGVVAAGPLQLISRLLAIGDVASDADHACDRSVVVLEHASPPLDPSDAPVRATAPMLNVVPRGRLERVTDRVPHHRTIFGMDDLLVRLVRAVERPRSEA